MSLHQTIQSLFHSAVRSVISHISDFVLRPGKDFARNRKFTAAQIIWFLITMGASSTRVGMLDFFGMDALMPTSSAVRQQRAKLRPEALSEIFHIFNTAYFSLGTVKKPIANGYRCIAADGSTTSFFSSDKFHTEDYFVSEGHSAPWWIPARFFLIGKTSTSVTGGIVPITIWPISLKKSSTSSSGPKMSFPKAWSLISNSPKKACMTRP